MSGWLIVLGILLGMALLIVVGLFACSYLLFRMVFDRRGRICLEAVSYTHLRLGSCRAATGFV